MAVSLRERAITTGSTLVLVVVILLVSADAETAVALGAFCVIGYAGYHFYRSSDRTSAVRSRLTTRTKRGVGTLVAIGVIAFVADEANGIVWLAAIAGLGYVGYRSGSVTRGALSGATLGVVGSIVVVGLVGSLLLLASVLGIGDTREIAIKVLFAPHVVGFFTLLWSIALVAFGGLFGLVSGSVGGAIARLTRT